MANDWITYYNEDGEIKYKLLDIEKLSTSELYELLELCRGTNSYPFIEREIQNRFGVDKNIRYNNKTNSLKRVPKASRKY